MDAPAKIPFGPSSETSSDESEPNAVAREWKREALELWDEDEDDDPADLGYMPKRERHGDHWHKIRTFHPWNDGHLLGWTTMDRIATGDRCHANPELEQMADVQALRKTLRDVTPATLPDIRDRLIPSHLNIPLCEGENGWHYQLELHCCGSSSLPKVYCQRTLEGDFSSCSPDFCQLKGNMPAPTIEVPNLVMSLGSLQIRNASGGDGSVMMTERTDYTVLVDAGSEDMPVWIAATHRELSVHNKTPALRPELPIFKGEMTNNDGGYHLACILPSIHCLSLSDAESEAASGATVPKMPTFEEICELVRQTRCSTDPFLLVAHKHYANELLNILSPPNGT